MRTLTKLLAGATLALVFVGITASTAAAHNPDQSYVYLEVFGDELEGRVEIPVEDLNDLLDLDLPTEGADDAVAANLATIQQYVDDHFAMSDMSGEEWEIVYEGYGIVGASVGDFAVIEFVVDENFGDAVPRQFQVTYDGVIHANSDAQAFLLIATDFGSGTFNNEADFLLRFTDDATTRSVDLDDSSWWSGMQGVIGLGVDHIRIGTDHILFVVALLLPSVLVYSSARQWEPTPSFGSGLWRVLKIATMFTVAHSITLTLGGLEIVELPPKPVEALIAISIALAALHNFYPVFANKEWLLAFAFGLFHGLGFAGLLTELGLDRNERVWSLLGFNIGIELGQIVIILMAFPVLYLLRRTPAYDVVFRGGSVLLATVAMVWAVERVFETEVGIDQFIDPIVKWPRALFVALVAIGLAAAAERVYAGRGQLRQTAGSTDAETVPSPAEAEDRKDEVEAVEG